MAQKLAFLQGGIHRDRFNFSYLVGSEGYNGRAKVENRIKEAKSTQRWDKTSCHRFEADQAHLKMGAVAYNLLHMIREFHLHGEHVKRSMEWLIRRIIKATSTISYSGRRWGVHVATSFPLAHHYKAALGTG